MQPVGEFLVESRIDPALPRDAIFVMENVGDNEDTIMRLAAFARPGMAGMQVRFVDNFDVLGRERVSEETFNAFGTGHMGSGLAGSCLPVTGTDDIFAPVYKQSQPGARRSTARSHRQGRDWPLDPPVEPAASVRVCDHPDCTDAGEHRAPRSRDALQSYYWFCLDHVRAYNKAWNYYADMSDTEVEAERHKDTFWHRPTWPLGGNRGRDAELKDLFGLFEDTESGENRTRQMPAQFHESAPELAALATMDLKPPVTIDMVKARYKVLVKQHHPDANGGDKQAEERLKEINQAYATLVRSFGA